MCKCNGIDYIVSNQPHLILSSNLCTSYIHMLVHFCLSILFSSIWTIEAKHSKLHKRIYSIHSHTLAWLPDATKMYET